MSASAVLLRLALIPATFDGSGPCRNPGSLRHAQFQWTVPPGACESLACADMLEQTCRGDEADMLRPVSESKA